MTALAARFIDALRTGHDDLVAKVAGLGPDDLVRPSGASEWTVAQVLSHLGSGAEIQLAILAGAFDGTGAPEQEFYQSVWARWDAMPPGEQAVGFPPVDEQLVSRYEAMDEQTRADLRVDFGFLPQPVDVATAAGMRLNELALHSWDVRVAFDPDARVAPEATELLVDRVGGLLGYAAHADRFDGNLTLAVHTTDPDRDFGLVIADAVTLTELPAAADGQLTAPAEYVLRLISGRHRADHTPDSVSLTGTTVTLDELRQVFPGF